MNPAGIDYGMGLSNRDHETGIRYGVISQHSISIEALDEAFESVYEPGCPETGDQYANGVFDTLTADSDTFTCPACEHEHTADECYGDEPSYHKSNDPDYELADCLDSDIMVLRSPFYTLAAFCSPCVPGAGNLDTPIEDGVRTYALGHDWFESGQAPYALYNVSDDSEVQA